MVLAALDMTNIYTYSLVVFVFGFTIGGAFALLVVEAVHGNNPLLASGLATLLLTGGLVAIYLIVDLSVIPRVHIYLDGYKAGIVRDIWEGIQNIDPAALKGL